MYLDLACAGVPDLDVVQVRGVSRAFRCKAPCAIVFHRKVRCDMLRESLVVRGFARNVVFDHIRAAVAGLYEDEVPFL